MREPSWSLVPAAKCGLSRVGALPPQHLEQAAAAALGRLVDRLATAPWPRRNRPEAGSPAAPSAPPPPSAARRRGGTARPPSPGRSDHANHVRSWDASQPDCRSRPDAPAILQDACKVDGNRPRPPPSTDCALIRRLDFPRPPAGPYPPALAFHRRGARRSKPRALPQ